ncbi:MAG: hypothetical protein FJW93_03225 [Actinobacteria bacterium]|nr:hypothetical protein [Actinomycetota bacterium]
MELIIVITLVFLVGYALGRKRSRLRPTASTAGRPASTRPSTRAVHREYSREREYDGFGALGATNEASDFGEGSS